ncbi:LexA family protein [Zymobacter palmae]|uniref:LexA family protein n=1 Tax=Zymobacter palmae TaxID=33074 RepID=UPI000572033C|nr:S24 family peptidase [Zymobacter palmae]
MKKFKRTELTPEQLTEAKRLKEIYSQRKAEAKARGDRLTQEDIAEACGWTGQSAVSQYMNGRIALNLDALVKLSRALSFDPIDVSKRLARHIPQPNQRNVEIAGQPSNTYRYPVVNWVAAGSWAEAVEPYEPGGASEYMETTYRVPGGEAFWLEVRGDSMTSPAGPSIPEGAMILVVTQIDAQPGDLVVAKLEDSQEATFKKLVEDGGQRYLKPLNPSYPLIKINGNCRLVGVVKQAVQTF